MKSKKKSNSKHADLIKAQYSRKFGTLAGYLPPDLSHLDNWLEELSHTIAKSKSEPKPIQYKKSVKAMADLIATDGIVRMYVTEMIAQVPPKNKIINSVEDLLDTINHMIQRAPEFQSRSHFPFSALFVYMMFTPAGENAFRNQAFNDSLRLVLQEWCNFLDSPKSKYVLDDVTGWMSPDAYWANKLWEYDIPKEGFKSFNAYFHRPINLEFRPLADPDNSKVIVSPNDGTVYRIARNVKPLDTFWIKSQPYSLVNMLDNNFVNEFIGGDVFQTFLSGSDYHRWRAPISGKIVMAKVVDGLMFSELHSLGFDSSAGTKSQGYEAMVNTRGIVFIQSDDSRIGLVCVIPIGITEISSVTITAKVNSKVKKGEPLGYFSYGGSSMAVVFQPGVIKKFIKKVPPAEASGNLPSKYTVKTRGAIAIAY